MTLAIDRLKHIEQTRISAALISSRYLSNDGSQTYKSMAGQKQAFVKFHEFMFGLSDEEIQSALKKHKNFVAKNYELTKNDYFLDVQMTKCAIHYQLELRSGLTCEIDLLEDIAKDWRSDVRLSSEHPEITSEALIKFIKELPAITS